MNIEYFSLLQYKSHHKFNHVLSKTDVVGDDVIIYRNSNYYTTVKESTIKKQTIDLADQRSKAAHLFRNQTQHVANQKDKYRSYYTGALGEVATYNFLNDRYPKLKITKNFEQIIPKWNEVGDLKIGSYEIEIKSTRLTCWLTYGSQLIFDVFYKLNKKRQQLNLRYKIIIYWCSIESKHQCNFEGWNFIEDFLRSQAFYYKGFKYIGADMRHPDNLMCMLDKC